MNLASYHLLYLAISEIPPIKGGHRGVFLRLEIRLHHRYSKQVAELN